MSSAAPLSGERTASRRRVLGIVGVLAVLGDLTGVAPLDTGMHVSERFGDCAELRQLLARSP